MKYVSRENAKACLTRREDASANDPDKRHRKGDRHSQEEHSYQDNNTGYAKSYGAHLEALLVRIFSNCTPCTSTTATQHRAMLYTKG